MAKLSSRFQELIVSAQLLLLHEYKELEREQRQSSSGSGREGQWGARTSKEMDEEEAGVSRVKYLGPALHGDALEHGEHRVDHVVERRDPVVRPDPVRPAHVLRRTLVLTPAPPARRRLRVVRATCRNNGTHTRYSTNESSDMERTLVLRLARQAATYTG